MTISRSGSAKRSQIEVISLVFMTFAAGIGFSLGLLAGDAFLLDAFEFLGEFVKLTREASFVAAEDVEGVGLFEPGAGLRDHDFDPVVVVRVGSVLDQAEVEHVVFHAGQTVQTEIALDDLLGELALELGFGFER